MAHMRTIQTSEAERQRGHLSAESIELAIQSILEDGIVILEGVVDLEHCRILADKMLEEVEDIAKKDAAPFNWHRGNLQQPPPTAPAYIFRDVLANDFVIDVTKALLGKGMKNAFYSSNTAMPSQDRQPVHVDLGQLWRNQDPPHPPFGLVVNIAVVDMDPENGSTEIWPATHLDTTVVIEDGKVEVPEQSLEVRRVVAPPYQPTVKQGSAIIRDIRLWHCGTPNRTATPRPMIAMIHYINWWPEEPFNLHVSAKTSLDHPDLRQHAHFVGDLGLRF